MTTSSLIPKIAPASPYFGEPLRPPLGPRAELYWDPLMWAGGTELTWESRAVAEQVGTLTAREAKRSKAECLLAVLDDPVALDLLATIAAWGTVTVEQAYALAGHELRCADPAVWRHLPRAVQNLFGAGVIERGRSVSPGAQLPVALRITKGRQLTSLLRRLDPDTHAWVTGGQPVTAPTRGDRHGLLATELGLLIAEYSYVDAVVGPAHSKVSQLLPDGMTTSGRRAADLTLGFESGERLAIELTCSANMNRLRAKIRAWIAELCRAHHDDMGLRVVFVEAADPVRQTPNEVWSPLARILADELRNNPYAMARGIGSRILLARWKGWAGPEGIDDGLGLLLCLATDIDVKGNPTFDERGLFLSGLDEFEPRDPTAFQQTVREYGTLAACPATLRSAGR